MLRTGRSRVRIPEGARDFSFLENVLTGSGYWGSFPGMKRSGREATLSRAEIMNEWRYTSYPSICPQCLDSEKLYIFMACLTRL